MSSNQPIVSPMHERPPHVPRLSYRNSSHSGYLSVESRASTSTVGTVVTATTAITSSTISTSPSDVENGPRSPGLPVLTLSSSHSPTSRPSSARFSTISTTAQSAKKKKKPSFLGSLFTKEPSTDAFLQMQDQSRKQLAQNPGRKNPPGMSGVSSVKMPVHVPKVNSKWDGMPQTRNDAHERTSSRAESGAGSTRTSSTRSRSADPGDRRSHRKQLSGSTTSSSHANRDRSRKRAHEHHKLVGFGDVDSVAESASSSNSMNHPRSKSISIRTQSLRSPSGTSLPQITSFFPNDIPEPPGVPQIYRNHTLSQDSAKGADEEHDTKDVPTLEEPRPGGISDHASSPSLTSSEQSPITPLSELTTVQHLGPAVVIDDSLSFLGPDFKLSGSILQSSGPDVLGLPIANKKVSKESIRAFLAGEARPLLLSEDEEQSRRPKSVLKKGTQMQVFTPTFLVQQDLEKRPDSSRARLGLRASMIRSSDAVPWEWNEEKDAVPDEGKRVASPKTLRPKSLGIFGKT
jgi:hypothetical protein